MVASHPRRYLFLIPQGERDCLTIRLCCAPNLCHIGGGRDQGELVGGIAATIPAYKQPSGVGAGDITGRKNTGTHMTVPPVFIPAG